jgi:hypothetical protein
MSSFNCIGGDREKVGVDILLAVTLEGRVFLLAEKLRT